VLIVLRPCSLGEVLVESRGRTVYLFRNHSCGKNSCTAAWFTFSGAGQVVSRPASESGGGSIY
jgi:hypothetical protein